MRLYGYLVIILVNMDYGLIYAQYHNLNPREDLIPRIRGAFPNVRNQAPYRIKNEYHERPLSKNYGHKSYYSSNVDEDQFDYDEFPEMPPFLELYSGGNVEQNNDNLRWRSDIRKQPFQKRYLGIDIPDYISNGGKANAIKNMSNKMKAIGKRK